MTIRDNSAAELPSLPRNDRERRHLESRQLPLLSKPVKIEVKQLETDSAFLSTASIRRNLQSITVNLTNPELTILNQSGAAVGVAPTTPYAN